MNLSECFVGEPGRLTVGHERGEEVLVRQPSRVMRWVQTGPVIRGNVVKKEDEVMGGRGRGRESLELTPSRAKRCLLLLHPSLSLCPQETTSSSIYTRRSQLALHWSTTCESQGQLEGIQLPMFDAHGAPRIPR